MAPTPATEGALAWPWAKAANAEAAKLLLAAGAKVKSRRYLALRAAVVNGSYEVLRLFLPRIRTVAVREYYTRLYHNPPCKYRVGSWILQAERLLESVLKKCKTFWRLRTCHPFPDTW